MRLFALVVAATLLLAGCGDNPEPKPMPKPSSTASATASATPPEMPEAASEKSKKGAIAFTRHFLSAMKYAGASGDTTAFEATYTPNCTRCEAITKGITDTYNNGGHIEGGAWIPERFKAYAIDSSVAFVDVVVSYEPQTYVASEGATPKTSPATPRVLKTFELIWQSDSWRVGALDPEA